VIRPDGMSAKVWETIGKLPPDKRDRVLERAAILIFQAGVAPADADARALAEEAGISTQYSLIGGSR
jgi:hypothetical protein